MKDLRQQLDAARAEYRAVKYPGDLAADALRQVHRPRRWVWLGAMAATSAAAACVALLVWMQPPAAPAPGTSSGIAVGPTTSNSLAPAEQYSLSEIARPAQPSIPASPGAFPTRQGISRPSLPSLPSWDALRQQQSSTPTEESA